MSSLYIFILKKIKNKNKNKRKTLWRKRADDIYIYIYIYILNVYQKTYSSLWSLQSFIIIFVLIIKE